MNRASASPTRLDARRFPLTGSRLIEASAGTGKTFTIATLYLRLVLGHGGDRAFVRPLTPPEILVVTFTDAATQELRDRIRRRLAEVARYFRADPATVRERAAGEDPLHDLRADYPAEDWPTCARRLQLAAEWMDEAAVSTIHGWCHRMLREHAFDSGSLFTQQLETDQSELLAEAVRDYWRTFLVRLDIEEAAEVRTWFVGPEDLQKKLGGLIPHAELLEPAEEPCAALKTAREERMRRLGELKAPWHEWVPELQRLLDEAREKKQFNGQSLKKNSYDAWLNAIALWRDKPDQVDPGLSDAAKRRLTVAGLAEIWRTAAPPEHPGLTALAALDERLARLPDAHPALLRHAARWVAARVAQEQARQASMGFQELLTRLDGALQGANGARLAATIRRQFPVALIDEFQDTDPVQYRIFDAVYRVADPLPDTALVLIGDPKQAIYSFRGADIYAYLAARRDCAERLYTLDRNFRSTDAAVEATNRCFEIAEQRVDGAGAFLFRRGADNPVPFLPALANGRPEMLTVDGEPLPALTLCWLPTEENGNTIGKGVYFDKMAEICAGEMVRLLNRGHSGRAAFCRTGETCPLRPGDLAVLVNSRHEAAAIRRALARRGIRSVYLSERDSVFQCDAAVELQYWLEAAAEPDDIRRVHAALATPTLALRWEELEALQRDEILLEQRVVQFHRYGDCWRRQGVLPMIRRILNDFGVPARLLDPVRSANRAESGERILTDILHLAELLQQAAGLLDGEHALIRHLAEQRQEKATTTSGDARQIRLESDADLVQVVTVHKAKGLEYPLVFLPFAANFRAVDRKKDLPLKWHDRDGRFRIALTAEDDSAIARADDERLGEDLRKLYVALTRAQHATWVGLAPLKSVELSAFGYLLNGGNDITGNELGERLDELAAGQPDIRVCLAEEPSDERFVGTEATAAIGTARESRRVTSERWWIASYSALVGSLDHGIPATHSTGDTVTEEEFLELEPQPAEAMDPTPTCAEPDSCHDFPRGPEAGALLHELLEWAAERGFPATATEPDLLRDLVARRCSVRGWQHWIDPLTDWIRNILATPLRIPGARGMTATTLSLTDLDTAAAELEFWIGTTNVAAEAIDRLVRMHTLDGADRPPIPAASLNGMLKGFIDLVFQHEGRYYVADYKSNWLGSEDAAYTPSALRAEILRARYDLQYVLYLLALHRLLRARLPDYDYDRHVGGAVYLFLRGLKAPSQGLHAERPPRELIDALDALFAGTHGKAAT